MTYLEKLNRLKNKKGFTVVELLVVVGIVGILLAIVVPVFRQGDRLANSANEKSRDFYYTIQSAMADARLSKVADIKLDAAGPNASVVVKIEKDGSALSAEVVFGDETNDFEDFDMFSAFLIGDSSVTPPEPGKLDTFLNAGEHPLEYYYFTIDKNYRVLAAYYTWGATEIDFPTPATPATFELPNRIDGIIVGSFPLEAGDMNQTIPA